MKLVGPRFGHGVDARARKTGLRDVVGRQGHLHLFDGIERNGLRVGLSAWRGGIEAEGVHEDGPVEGEVVEPAVAPAKRAVATRHGGEAGVVEHRPFDGGQHPQLFAADVGVGAGASAAHHVVGIGPHRHRGEGRRFRLQGHVQRIALAQHQRDVVDDLSFVAHIRHRDFVGTTHPHVGQHVFAVAPDRHPVLGARWLVNGHHRRPRQGCSALF